MPTAREANSAGKRCSRFTLVFNAQLAENQCWLILSSSIERRMWSKSNGCAVEGAEPGPRLSTLLHAYPPIRRGYVARPPRECRETRGSEALKVSRLASAANDRAPI